jgi:hypothetical protein
MAYWPPTNEFCQWDLSWYLGIGSSRQWKKDISSSHLSSHGMGLYNIYFNNGNMISNVLAEPMVLQASPITMVGHDKHHGIGGGRAC